MNIGSFNASNSFARTVTLGTSSITLTAAGAAFSIAQATALTFSATSSTLTFTGAAGSLSSSNIGGSAQSFGTINLFGSGVSILSTIAGTTFKVLNRTGTASKTDGLTISSALTVTSSMTVAGNSVTNRLLVQSTTLGTSSTFTVTGATVNAQNVDFQDIALSPAQNLSAITGGSGDTGGNSGITFTTADTETWTNAAGGAWSGANWSGASVTRVPLPQDNVSLARVGGNYNSGITISADVPRLGHSISMVGATWTGTAPQLAAAGVLPTIYGGLTMITGFIATNGSWTFGGRNGALANATSSLDAYTA